MLHFSLERANPFGYAVIDVKTYAMAMLRKPYRACGKPSMPADWFDPVSHTHVALDDALEQGNLFCNMLKANISQPWPGSAAPPSRVAG